MLPFTVKTTVQKNQEDEKKKKAIRCEQQAIANQLVNGSIPQQTNAQPITQQPAKQ